MASSAVHLLLLAVLVGTALCTTLGNKLEDAQGVQETGAAPVEEEVGDGLNGEASDAAVGSSDASEADSTPARADVGNGDAVGDNDAAGDEVESDAAGDEVESDAAGDEVESDAAGDEESDAAGDEVESGGAGDDDAAEDDDAKALALPDEVDESDEAEPLPESEQIFHHAVALHHGNNETDVDLDAALEHYERAADLGLPAAMFRAGEMYLIAEDGVPERDVEHGLTLVSAAAELGDADAQWMLAYLHAAGVFVPHDLPTALTYMTFAAHQGQPRAKLALAWRHRYGYGVPRSCEEAQARYVPVSWVAANHNSVVGKKPAWERVRLDNEKEVYTAQDGEDDDMIQQYHYLADNGDVGAAMAVGGWYHRGERGVARNPERAMRYYRQAADAGNVNAMVTVGSLYRNGVGVDANNETALEWMEKAADTGEPAGLCGLGYVYYNDGNYTEAFALFERAADKGYVEAQYNVAVMYLDGRGVDKSQEDAHRYLTMCAAKGHFQSVHRLGIAHYQGWGVGKSCAKTVGLLSESCARGNWSHVLREGHEEFLHDNVVGAAVRYAEASEMGYETAHFNAAWLYENYDLPWVEDEPDRQQRVCAYYKRSAQQGTAESAVKVGDCYFFGGTTPPPLSNGDRDASGAYSAIAAHAPAHAEETAMAAVGSGGFARDLNKAAHYYEMSAKAKNSQAMYNLAWMHEHGVGRPRDLHIAHRYLKEAEASSGDKRVAVRLALWMLEARIFAARHEATLAWLASADGVESIAIGVLTAVLAVVVTMLVLRRTRRAAPAA